MSREPLTDKEQGGVLVDLGEDRSTELAVVGGKGASLGRLVKADFPVPAGFVVSTAGYAAFLRANALEDEIRKINVEMTIVGGKIVYEHESGTKYPEHPYWSWM